MIDAKTCLGCQACVDLCPTKAIRFSYTAWGEGVAVADAVRCRHCGACERVCPGLTARPFAPVSSVFAALSRAHRETGSSGGLFYELASRFLRDGGTVYGAAFDNALQLRHRRVTAKAELLPLCKSKYLYSDMADTYRLLAEDLAGGQRVLFVGTPCQVSAVKNRFGERYADTLFTADFLCHGAGTQRVFDLCRREEEAKRGGTMTAFCFRAKTRKAEHSFSYRLNRRGTSKTVSGYAFEYPYYHAFLRYTIFRDACYNCRYAQLARVGDLTLGDFWGIQHYVPRLRDAQGVSLLSVNSEKGQALLQTLREVCDFWELPVACAVKHNQSFREPERRPAQKAAFVRILEQQGEAALVNAMACPHIRKERLYARLPHIVKQWYRKRRGSR